MGERLRLHLAVASGAALGSVARYLASLAAQAVLGDGFGWGTLCVNAAGSFLIGVLAVLAQPHGRLRLAPAGRLFLMVGFCGGFTTFSMFSLEMALLMRDGLFGAAALAVVASVSVWLVAAWLGHRLGDRLDAGAGGSSR